MLFIKRHKIQNSSPQQEGYAIYDTSLLSQYVAYNSEDDVSDKISSIKYNNFQSIYTYIPQFFSGTDDVNREFIRANYSGQTIYPVSSQWSLIEVCFAPYSGYDYSIGEGYIVLREGSSISLEIHHNDNYSCIYTDLGYEDSNQEHYTDTVNFFRAHYDGTRVLCTLFLVFIEDKVRTYLGVDDGFDQYDSYIRKINNNVAYVDESTIYTSELEDAKTIASLDLYPYIGDEIVSSETTNHNTNARVYSVRKFSGMGNLANNSLDRVFAQHFEVDKALFLRDAITNHGGN